MSRIIYPPGAAPLPGFAPAGGRARARSTKPEPRVLPAQWLSISAQHRVLASWKDISIREAELLGAAMRLEQTRAASHRGIFSRPWKLPSDFHGQFVLLLGSPCVPRRAFGLRRLTSNPEVPQDPAGGRSLYRTHSDWNTAADRWPRSSSRHSSFSAGVARSRNSSAYLFDDSNRS